VDAGKIGKGVRESLRRGFLILVKGNDMSLFDTWFCDAQELVPDGNSERKESYRAETTHNLPPSVSSRLRICFRRVERRYGAEFAGKYKYIIPCCEKGCSMHEGWSFWNGVNCEDQVED
jgi:hypothetical protein